MKTFNELKEEIGSQQIVADSFGLSKQLVSQWVKKNPKLLVSEASDGYLVENPVTGRIRRIRWQADHVNAD